ncbi:type III secretion system export apparatus subunit SctS [uncultured Stenotrophomonas sp.]|uniref:type III secretion system export apparatus subunit SctS n=1 Tax=uncultured Stenotrophomonas sp. TaxID=165438 RepID=UPI0025EBCE6B|nr:type III secretion system export apparatus subunit SctS [uncultured Stenotrophomonas sp.]HDS1581778.1 type III secretion system export apparatus subunit SctS [Stenotrophomonas maltophilia]
MEALTYISNKALLLILLLSAGPVLVATVVGLAIGLFQTVTQLQEQTLPYGAKLLAVIACLWLMMGWIGAQLLDFARLALQHALQG